MSDEQQPDESARTQEQPADEQHGDETDWKAEARKWQKRSQDNYAAAQELQQLKEQRKSESERLNERATKAEQTAQQWQSKYSQLVVKQAVIDAASTANSIDPETVYLHLKDGIDLDEDGTPRDLDKAVKDLAKRKPHLFRTVSPAGRDATAGGSSTARSMDDIIRGR